MNRAGNVPEHYPLYWLAGRNFGDALNPILYERITGYPVRWSDQSPKILAEGSIMGAAGPADHVWGTGCISADVPLHCDQSTVFHAIRGPLTGIRLVAQGIKLPRNLILGSPSWLLPRFVKSSIMGDRIGFLPHYIDYGQIDTAALPGNVDLLWTATEPLELIAQITACKMLVSSSLHGLIVAEAYGIPAVWVELADNIGGAGFKFRDYYASTKRQVDALNWRGGYNWQEAERQAAKWKPLKRNLDPLLGCCPFGLLQDETFVKRSESCQIPGLSHFYDQYFPGKTNGIFVEIGGNDGYLWSNTWGLAEIGWKGFYFEPVAALAEKCAIIHAKNNIKVVQTAIGDHEGTVNLYTGAGGATTNPVIAENDLFLHGNDPSRFESVPMITANKALTDNRIPHIFDLLVIDANGGEPDVLKGLDLDTWRPKMIIVATHKSHDGWNINAVPIAKLLQRYYQEVYYDSVNSIYIRKDETALPIRPPVIQATNQHRQAKRS